MLLSMVLMKMVPKMVDPQKSSVFRSQHDRMTWMMWGRPTDGTFHAGRGPQALECRWRSIWLEKAGHIFAGCFWFNFFGWNLLKFWIECLPSMESLHSRKINQRKWSSSRAIWVWDMSKISAPICWLWKHLTGGLADLKNPCMFGNLSRGSRQRMRMDPWSKRSIVQWASPHPGLVFQGAAGMFWKSNHKVEIGWL